MKERAFFDTNIPIYAFMDHVDERKKRIATQLLQDAVDGGSGVISLQVMNEFLSVISRKSRLALSREAVQAYVDFLKQFKMIGTDLRLIEVALRRTYASKINYYDALIVEAAIRSGAATLYSEDMQHGVRYGDLQVVNPFLPL